MLALTVAMIFAGGRVVSSWANHGYRAHDAVTSRRRAIGQLGMLQ